MRVAARRKCSGGVRLSRSVDERVVHQRVVDEVDRHGVHYTIGLADCGDWRRLESASMKRCSLVVCVRRDAGRLSAQPARRPVSLIVIGGTVITQNAAHRILSPGAVAIDGTDIVDVDTPGGDRGAVSARPQTIDARDQIVLPGLINTHTHAPMVMYRGLADDLALMDWLQKYIFPAEAKTVSPELVRIGTRLAALEMIESGTTTFADMYYFEEEIAQGDASRRGCAACSGRRSSSSRSPTRRRRPRRWRAPSASSRSSRTTA